MEEIKQAEQAIKELKDFIELRKAAAKLVVDNTKAIVLSLAKERVEAAMGLMAATIDK